MNETRVQFLKHWIIKSCQTNDEQLIMKYLNITQDNLFKKCTGYYQQDKTNPNLTDTTRNNVQKIHWTDLLDIIIKSNYKCYWCHQIVKPFSNVPKPKKDKLLYTLDRLDNTTFHTKENCVLSCLSCNVSKVGSRNANH